MLNSDELFLYFAQVGTYAVFRDDGTGRPEFRVPAYDKIYTEFAHSIQNSPQLDSLSEEIFEILRKFATYDYLHNHLTAYIKTEKELRKNSQPHLNYDLAILEREFEEVRPFFQAQYSSELKAQLNLSPDKIPEHLLTGTGGRIVRLKDYLFWKGPLKDLKSVPLLNHKGRESLWRSS